MGNDSQEPAHIDERGTSTIQSIRFSNNYQISLAGVDRGTMERLKMLFHREDDRDEHTDRLE